MIPVKRIVLSTLYSIGFSRLGNCVGRSIHAMETRPKRCSRRGFGHGDGQARSTDSISSGFV
ncbi:unnamed protein product [Arabidopsis halleri]